LEVSDEELDDIQRQERDDAVQPDNSSPTPANASDVGEAPGGVHCNEGGDLCKKNHSFLSC